MTEDEKSKLDIVVDKVSQIHTVLLGVPGTEDKGVCGDLSEIKKQLKNINSKTKSNSLKISGLYGIIGIIIVVLLHLMGVY